MNRWIWITLALLMVGALVYWGYRKVTGTIEHIEDISVKKVVIGDMSMEGSQAHFAGFVVLTAGIPEPLSPERVVMDMKLNDRLPLETTMREPRRAAGPVDTFYFQTSLPLTTLIEEARRLQRTDSSRITGRITIPFTMPVTGEDKRLEIDVNERVRHPKPPKIEPGTPRVDKFGLQNMEITLPVYFENLDDYHLALRGLTFTTEIGDNIKTESREKRTLTLGPHSRDTLMLPMRMKIDKPLDIAGDILRGSDRYPIRVRANLVMAVGPDAQSLESFPIMLNVVDTIELRPSKEERQERRRILDILDRGKGRE